MKKILFALLSFCLCSCAAPQGEAQEIDVYETGRIDLDGDGIPEQLVITSGGGTGGPIWYIARLSGEELLKKCREDYGSFRENRAARICWFVTGAAERNITPRFCVMMEKGITTYQ